MPAVAARRRGSAAPAPASSRMHGRCRPAGAGDIGQGLDPLLLAHIAAIEGDHRLGRQAELPGGARSAAGRIADVSTQLGNRRRRSVATPFSASRATIAGVMLLTRWKRRSSQDFSPSARRRSGPPPETMPSAKAASISKSWIWSKAAAPPKPAASHAPGVRPAPARWRSRPAAGRSGPARGRPAGCRRRSSPDAGSASSRGPGGHIERTAIDPRAVDRLPAPAPGGIARARCARRDSRAGRSRPAPRWPRPASQAAISPVNLPMPVGSGAWFSP